MNKVFSQTHSKYHSKQISPSRSKSQFSSEQRYQEAKNEIPRFNEDFEGKSNVGSMRKTKRHGGKSSMSRREHLEEINSNILSN